MDNMDPINGNLPLDHPIGIALKKIADDIRVFIELSLHETDASWEEWLQRVIQESEVNCWERKDCARKDCPAYMNTSARCWLTAGTMCGGKVQGEFALKYKNCQECDVYQELAFKNPVAEIYEHLITLVHSLKATQDKLKTMATRDLLTGLYNRNYFNETINREIERARRNREDLSVIIIDIDKFKQINDTYGHLHGDGVLKECANILSSAARKSDILCRFGGDEFLIITPKRGCSDNDALISRIKRNVSQWNNEYGSADYKLSLSMGCSACHKDRSLLEAISEADKMMYENKKKKAEST